MAKILIVDDSKVIVSQMQTFFEEQGHDVVTAANGEEGVARFQEGASSIDLVVSDLNMPKMSGLAMIEAIRASEGGGEVTVFVLTSGKAKESVELGRALKVRAWIVKPVDLVALNSAVKKVLSVA